MLRNYTDTVCIVYGGVGTEAIKGRFAKIHENLAPLMMMSKLAISWNRCSPKFPYLTPLMNNCFMRSLKDSSHSRNTGRAPHSSHTKESCSIPVKDATWDLPSPMHHIHDSFRGRCYRYGPDENVTSTKLWLNEHTALRDSAVIWTPCFPVCSKLSVELKTSPIAVSCDLG
jgi:hypothetical protein